MVLYDARNGSSRKGRTFIPDARSRAVARGIGFALTAGLAAYCLLSSVAGPAGALAHNKLLARKAAMEANLVSLSAANETLRADLESLRSDADRTAREARALGYLRSGETEIVLDGWKPSVKKLETGKVLPYDDPSSLPDRAIKEISFGVALAALAALFAPKRSMKGQKRFAKKAPGPEAAL